MAALGDFTTFSFSQGEWTRTVYRQGKGPPVIVMHEMPGITPKCVDFAQLVVDAGFTVFMPSLFGTPGAEPTRATFRKEFVRVFCTHHEFSLLARNHSSPVTDWLRALARKAHEEMGGRGVGAIGMCITGNFALTMSLDAFLMAPVLCQPGLPFSPLGISDRSVHAPPEALKEIRRRHAEDGFRVVGLRFKGDKICPAARFETLREKLGPAFDAMEIEDRFAAEYDAKGTPPHSVLTKELINEEGEPTHDALLKVLGFLNERLR